MARPIRNTPILYGEDARLFNIAAQQIVPEAERMRQREQIKQSVDEFRAFLQHIKAL